MASTAIAVQTREPRASSQPARSRLSIATRSRPRIVRESIIHVLMGVNMRSSGWTALILAAVSAPMLAADPNWSQWRGPDGQGVSREAGVPVGWGEGKDIGGTAPIPGRGHPDPIGWGDRGSRTA